MGFLTFSSRKSIWFLCSITFVNYVTAQPKIQSSTLWRAAIHTRPIIFSNGSTLYRNSMSLTSSATLLSDPFHSFVVRTLSGLGYTVFFFIFSQTSAFLLFLSQVEKMLGFLFRISQFWHLWVILCYCFPSGTGRFGSYASITFLLQQSSSHIRVSLYSPLYEVFILSEKPTLALQWRYW
jgi:hypothetical protein